MSEDLEAEESLGMQRDAEKYQQSITTEFLARALLSATAWPLWQQRPRLQWNGTRERGLSREWRWSASVASALTGVWRC